MGLIGVMPAGPAAMAVEDPLETIQRTIAGETTETGGLSVSNDGLLEASTTTASGTDGEGVSAVSTPESSVDGAPGEWPMGNRDGARTGDASWEEFVSLPMRQKWAVTTSDKVQVNPVVVGGVAFFGGAGIDRRVYAVELHTQRTRWVVQLPGSVVSAPAVTDHWVYVGSLDGRLYKLSRADGSLAWAYPSLDQPAAGSIWGGPVVHGGIAYFGTTDSDVYAVDTDTGALRWATSTPEAITAGVSLGENTIVAMSGANEWATALDPDTGAVRWQRKFYDWADSRTMGTAASVSWSKAYFTGLDKKLHIVWLSNGLDVVTPPDLGANAQNTPVLSPWGVFVGTNAGQVRSFDQLGTAKWTTTLPSSGIVSSPIHAAGRVWASSTDGKVYALDADNGVLEWSFATGGALFAPPAIVSNHLLVGSDDRNLYALTPGVPVNATHSPQAFTHYGAGHQPTQAYESDPISTSTGNYLYQPTDIVHRGGRGVPATFTRTYNSSAAATAGSLGYGWTHQWAVTVSATVDAATVTWGDGHTDTYPKDAAGNFVAPPDVDDVLVATADGYELSTPADLVWRFDTSGRLVSLTDASGNAILVGYDSGGNMTSVTDGSGRSIQLTYDAVGRIVTATDALGQAWTYTYDADGNLSTATDPAAGTWRYTYDGLHRLTSLTDPDGNLLASNTYDTEGRVAAQSDSTGATWTFTYGAATTTVTDPLGHQTIYEFDANWRTTKVTDATGGTTELVYDEASNLVAIVDAGGRQRRFAYDDRGNLTASLDAAGQKTAYRWDSSDNLTHIVDARGHTTEYSYDTAGRVTAVKRPSGATTAITYRTDGLPDTVTDAARHVTTLGYDTNGLLTAITDPLGRTTTVALNVAGKPAAVTDPTGATTSYTYDPRGLLRQVTDPLSHSTGYGYDGDGQLTTATDANGNTTTYVHDARGLLTSITDPLGRTTSLTYDAARRLSTRTDPRNTTISYQYDPAGRLVTIDLPDQADLTYTYDLAGQLTSTVDPTGTTSYGYDNAGRQVSETRGFVGMRLFHDYDILNRRIGVKAVRSDGYVQALHRYTYTVDGQYATVNDTYQGTTSLTYDNVGRLSQLVQPSAETATYTYDAAGQLIRLAHDHPELALSTWTYTYDDAGRTTAERRSFTASTGLADFVNTYGYDLAGRLSTSTTTDPAAPPTANATFSYDPAGNRTQVAPVGLAPITYTYDAANQLTADTLNSYDHDTAGNMLARRPLGQTEPTATYEWNALGQLSAISGIEGSTNFSYDAMGRRVRQQSPTDTSDYIFDGGNLLVEQVTKDLTTHWTTSVHAGPMLVGASFPAAQQFFHPNAIGNIGEASVWTWGEATSPWVSTGITGQVGPVAVYADADVQTQRYSYAPHGESNRTEAGSLTDPHLDRHTYSGSWGVRDIGDVYDMRNRMYDPSLGRFTSQDAWPANAAAPDTWNRYAYAVNSPTNYIDPYGLYCLFGRNPDDSCRGQGVISAVNTGASAVTAVAAGAIVVFPPSAAIAGPVMLVTGPTAVATGGISTFQECTENGLTSACGLAAGGVALDLAGIGAVGAATRTVDDAIMSGRMFIASRVIDPATGVARGSSAYIDQVNFAQSAASFVYGAGVGAVNDYRARMGSK